MSSDSALPPPHIPAGQPQNGSVRFVLALLVLCATSVAWGCAGRAGTQPNTIHCPNSVHTKVSAAKPTVRVSYTEPSVTVAGGSLNDLAKTTIYYDLGNGRALAKEIPATSLTGGGQISEPITVPIQTQGEQTVRICVTATDRRGNESPMAPLATINRRVQLGGDFPHKRTLLTEYRWKA
jgi:HYR domain